MSSSSLTTPPLLTNIDDCATTTATNGNENDVDDATTTNGKLKIAKEENDDEDDDNEESRAKTVMKAAASYASVKRESPYIQKEQKVGIVDDDCNCAVDNNDDVGDNEYRISKKNTPNISTVSASVSASTTIMATVTKQGKKDNNISKDNVVNKSVTGSTATKCTVKRLPVTSTLPTSASASASYTTTTAAVKQQAKKNDRYNHLSSSLTSGVSVEDEENSSSFFLSQIVAHEGTDLTRQRAGFVQAQTHGAFAITHPDFNPPPSPPLPPVSFLTESIMSDNTIATTASTSVVSESFLGTDVPPLLPPPQMPILTAVSVTTATALTTASTLEESRASDSTLTSTAGAYLRSSILIQAELVELPPRVSVFDIEADRLAVAKQIDKKHKKRNNIIISIITFLVIVLASGMTPLYIIRNKEPEPYGNDCFTTTLELYKMQIRDYIRSNYTQTNDTYTMCPGTTIDVGKFHRTQNDHEVTSDGKEKDFPITIIAPNTTVQCGVGLDIDEGFGPCVIHGGFRQVVLKPLFNPSIYKIGDTKEGFVNATNNGTNEGIEGHILNDPNDNITLIEWKRFLLESYNLSLSNVTLRDLTFTGTIESLDLVPGQSILVNQPGNITFDSCNWADMITPTGLVLVTNEYSKERSPLEGKSTQLSFRNCLFDDIKYNLPLFETEDEILVLDNCTIANLSIAQYFRSLLCDSRYTEFSDHKCAYLMGCFGFSTCEIKDSCAQDSVEISPSGKLDTENDWLHESIPSVVQVDNYSNECGFAYQRNGNDINDGCYDSTLKLLRAQIKDFRESNFTLTKERYVICPNTHIEIGLMEKFESNYYYDLDSDEDFPLIIIAPNTLVECGFNGDVNNLCVLDGGTQQIYISLDYELSINKDEFIALAGPQIDPDMTQEEWEIFADAVSQLRLDNVTIRGITLKGAPESEAYVLGQSIYIRQPGNFTLEDCHFTEMKGPTGIIEVTTVLQNEYYGKVAPLPNQSTQLTLRNCQFDTLLYNHPIILVQNQILLLENCTFDNINVTFNVKGSCGLYTESPDWGSDGCSYAIACIGESLCDINKSCMFNVDFDGTGWLFKTNSSTVEVDNQSAECGFSDSTTY